MTAFDQSLTQLDPVLFRHIDSQTTDADKRALLALQLAGRSRLNRPYRYLEIGSHLGGSLQPYVVDPLCESIISIDPRPTCFADERGLALNYTDNSTERMLANLRQIPGARLDHVQTIDRHVKDIAPSSLNVQPDLCFVDGEHTDAAALEDARFCAEVVHPEGCIFFHDANIVYRGIARFMEELTARGKKFQAFILPDSVFVVDFGQVPAKENAQVRALFEQNYLAYLHGLNSMNWYRDVLNKPLFKTLRQMRFVRRVFLVPGTDQQGV